MPLKSHCVGIEGKERQMETITEIRERHKREIETLQSACEHPTSAWMPFMWAPGHFGADVKVCEVCGKILARKTKV